MHIPYCYAGLVYRVLSSYGQIQLFTHKYGEAKRKNNSFGSLCMYTYICILLLSARSTKPILMFQQIGNNIPNDIILIVMKLYGLLFVRQRTYWPGNYLFLPDKSSKTSGRLDESNCFCLWYKKQKSICKMCRLSNDK